jgi:hypothetical protein
VGFNANPNSGQLILANGNWYVAGGTSVGCAATAGYDLVTGLGTPNAVKTVELLAAY